MEKRGERERDRERQEQSVQHGRRTYNLRMILNYSIAVPANEQKSQKTVLSIFYQE